MTVMTGLAPKHFGQGPSDLYLVLALCHYKNDVAFLELPAKIKIFTKKDNTYVWKETNSGKK